MKTLAGWATAAVLTATALVVGASSAVAAPVKISGNDCMPNDDDSAAGGTVRGGGGIGTCTLNGSPFIIRFNFNDDGSIATKKDGTDDIEFGGFGSITGNEFSFDFEIEDDETTGVGSWTYNPAGLDPDITGFVVKGGNDYWVYSLGGLTQSFTIDKGISHITFFDTEGTTTVIPLPAAAWLLLGGLGGLGLLARRRSA